MEPDRLPFASQLATVARLAAQHGVDVMLVGATARDVMLAREGLDRARRATNDVDIAVAVPDRAAFEHLAAELTPAHVGSQHKFVVDGVEVDIVPFGDIETTERTIIWPDGTVMNALGLAEALPNALRLKIGDAVSITVASLASQAALKTIAWSDRSSWTERDAADLGTIVAAHSDGDRLDVVYLADNEPVLESYDYDVVATGAHLLGLDIHMTMGPVVAHRCAQIVDDDVCGPNRLAPALRLTHPTPSLLVAAYRAGLVTTPAA